MAIFTVDLLTGNPHLFTGDFSTGGSGSGTTTPVDYYTKTEIDYYSASTKSLIDGKVDIGVFTGYTATTGSVSRRIQLVSETNNNVNSITPIPVMWSYVDFPYDSDIYTYVGDENLYINQSGLYEVSYHVLLRNSNLNQTHSIGGYIEVNGVALSLTSTAAMVVGANSSGELSMPSVMVNLGENDLLRLMLFRIGNQGTVTLVPGSVSLTVNKLV